MRIYQVRIDIYEAATDYAYPIVVHLFHGRTRAEAIGYHNAHRGADKFLRECEDKECFSRNVACRAILTEGWVDVAVMDGTISRRR